MKTAYKESEQSKTVLRQVTISTYGGKTFGEIIDAIDNSKEMTTTEKARRRTSAYAALAAEVEKQGIKF